MADYEQDIIRKVQIGVQVDTDTIKKSSATLDNFYKKYHSKDMKVDTSDFFKAVDAVRSLRKELDTVQKNSPHMEGIIGQMSSGLAEAGQQFKDAIIHFTNGDIAHGLNEAVDKITQGFQVKNVDLGNFLSTIQAQAQRAAVALQQIGAVGNNGRLDFTAIGELNIGQIEETIELLRRLRDAQSEIETFQGQEFTRENAYVGYTTSNINSYITNLADDLDELRRVNLNTIEELNRRRDILDNINSARGGLYYDFDDIKEGAQRDKAQYNEAIADLQNYVNRRQKLLQEMQSNSYLFGYDELNENTSVLEADIRMATHQLLELQDMKGIQADPQPISGDFAELVRVLNEIRTSL